MGGNLYPNSVRIYQEDYVEVFDSLKPLLKDIAVNYHFLLAYKNKPSMGDIDILIRSRENVNIKEILKSHYDLQTSKNGNTVSFPYYYSGKDEPYQVDLMIYNENYGTALNFYRHGDLGNIIGRIANRLNCKFGFEGLFYKYRNGQYKRDILLSKDIVEILGFLGWKQIDIDDFIKGFDTELDIFSFVLQNGFFHKSYFTYENLNHENRTRNKKRKMYGDFLEYVESLDDDYVNSKDALLGDVEFYYPYVHSNFPRVNHEINKIETELELKWIASSKFNGNVVKEITGFDGKELGKFIQKFKTVYDEHYILNADKDEIKRNIKGFYANYN